MIGSPVQFRDVTKAFGQTVALKAFNLDIAGGEFVTLLGASGSGKSTALNILAGFSDATSGDVFIDNKSMAGVPSERRNVGMVFQSFALFPHLTVADNVAYPLKMRRRPVDEIKRKVGEALELVQLSALAGRKPAALSGGQRQRVALARAVVFEPPVLLMDECLSALDLKLREELQREIRSIHRNLGVTVVFVTHDQTEALTMSDRIAILEGGKIVQIDTPERLYDRPRTRFVADFIGQSNTFDIVPGPNGTVGIPDLGVDIPLHGSAVAIALRPERLRLVEGAARPGEIVFEGQVEDETFFGPVVARSVRLRTGRLLEIRSARSGHGAEPAPGGQISLGFYPADVAPLAAE